jgi:hypothetical protein
MYRATSRRACSRVGYWVRWTRSFLSAAKNDSAIALVCPEGEREDFGVEDEVSWSSCCCGDEGRSFGIGMQVRVSNHHELLR